MGMMRTIGISSTLEFGCSADGGALRVKAKLYSLSGGNVYRSGYVTVPRMLRKKRVFLRSVHCPCGRVARYMKPRSIYCTPALGRSVLWDCDQTRAKTCRAAMIVTSVKDVRFRHGRSSRPALAYSSKGDTHRQARA